MIKFKTIKIISLILLLFILISYYPSILSNLDKRSYFTYKDIFTGQEWGVSKANNKIKEFPINVFDRLSGEKLNQYNKINNELDRLDKVIKDNQEAHDNYIDSDYTGGLTFDDLGINGGNTLSSWEVTDLLHEGAIKQIQGQQNMYLKASNRSSDLNQKINNLKYQLTNEAWDFRNIENNVRIFLIIVLFLIIFYKKLFRLTRRIFSFILND